MQASISEDEDYVISGSENGNVVIWNRENCYVPTINPFYTGFSKTHNSSFEYFEPFKGISVTTAQFAPLSVLQQVSQSLQSSKNPSLARQIIIACSAEGQINVYYQLIELNL